MCLATGLDLRMLSCPCMKTLPNTASSFFARMEVDETEEDESKEEDERKEEDGAAFLSP